MKYALVADAYRRLTGGEPLVADESYVEPLWSSTEVAVSCDPSYDPDFASETRTDFENEVAERVAAMIAIQTHGVAVIEGTDYDRKIDAEAKH